MMLTWLWWTTQGWPWLKKNWLYVMFFPVVLFAVVVSFLEGRRAGRVVVVDQRKESDAARDFEKKVEARKKEAVDELDRQLVERTEVVVKKHKSTLNRLTEEQRSKADALLDNPDGLNSYLREVSSRTR